MNLIELVTDEKVNFEIEVLKPFFLKLMMTNDNPEIKVGSRFLLSGNMVVKPKGELSEEKQGCFYVHRDGLQVLWFGS
jgi:hypothetical protein